MSEQAINRASERFPALDIIRGIAVFGILFVNLQGFAAPPQVTLGNLGWWPGVLDRIVLSVIAFFAVGKFYCLFSFLFGCGFAVQSGRSEDSRFARRYARRLITLFLFGLAHVCFLWWGDILHLYAVLGGGLFLFRFAPDRTLVLLAAVCLTVPMQLVVVETLAVSASDTDGDVKRDALEARRRFQIEADESVRVYAEGSFGEAVIQRLRDLRVQYSRTITAIPQIFGMFVLGFLAGRKGLFAESGWNRRLVRTVFKIGGIVGIPCNLVFAATFDRGDPFFPTPLGLVNGIAFCIGAPVLSLGYAAAVLLMFRTRVGEKILSPFAAVGRMALSHYLTQSLICVTLFHGLGWYGHVGPTRGLAIVVVVCAVQFWISARWLKRFRFGPMEWLWRAVTDGKGSR